MKTQTNVPKKRRISIFLKNSLVMVMVLLAVGAAACFSPQAASQFVFDKVADPATADTWAEFYGSDVLNTAQVGRIWTDKSVFDGNASLAGGPTVSRQNPDNFLVGLSALSSYKNIVGTFEIPLDVVLVLDISSSMRMSTNKGAISAMVDAANTTINTLYGLNSNNRVGVVFFDQTAFRPMPLDQYVPTAPETTYMSVVDGTGEAHIQMHATGATTGAVTDLIEATSGTYTQGGLKAALDTFAGALNKANRVPIMVLMSDGSPTISFTNYTTPDWDSVNVPNGMRNGTGSTGIAFVTQLTAAYVHQRMDELYSGDPMLYTLGFGLGSLSGNTGVLAKAVLDPSFNTREMDNYWNEFKSLGDGGTMDVFNVSTTPRTLTRVDDGLQAHNPEPNAINYVDEYFSAERAEDLQGVFESIIEEIELQSHSYPTQTGGENADMSGYLHFEDDIGEYMEVKSVNGLVYDEFFSGAPFAKALADAYQQYLQLIDGDKDEDGDTGGAEPGEGAPSGPAYSNLIYEFAKSSAARLGIVDINDAEALIVHALEKGQVYYNSDSSYGNAVWWYGNDGDSYLGPAASGTSPPTGATMLNQSYVFFQKDATGKTGPNLMYIGVRVKTNLATGRQTVVFTVPASMVPVVEYDVKLLDNDDVELATSAEVSKRPAAPVSLFYEVGLRGDITPGNIAGTVHSGYPYKSGGEYTFYTNDWTRDKALTNVTFTPALQNEFYYYYRNMTVYEQTGPNTYAPLTTPPVDGETYYYNSQLYGMGTAGVVQQYVAIPPATMAKVPTAGPYVIPAETPKLTAFTYNLRKSANPTGTFEDVRVLEPTEINGRVNVTADLGNNGLLRVTLYDPSPQTGDGSRLPFWLFTGTAALVGLGLFAFRPLRRRARQAQRGKP